jgi:hypothetical protein
MARFHSIRITAGRENQVAIIQKATGVSGFTAAVDVALAIAVSVLGAAGQRDEHPTDAPPDEEPEDDDA